MAYLLALGSAALYSVADFLRGLASRRTSTITVVFMSQAVGFVLLTLTVPVRLEFLILSLNPGLRHRCVAPGVGPTTTEVRSHASLKGHTPLTFAGGHMVARAELNNVSQVSHSRDLVQLPVAA